MRYNHRLHRHYQIHSPARHNRDRLTSLFLLAGLITVLLVINQNNGLNWRDFYISFGASLVRVVVAYVISVVLAMLLALITTRNKYFESLMLPILDVAQSFPSFALLPLLIAATGANSWAVIVILVINMIWPIMFNIVSAIKVERADLRAAATIYGAVGYKKLVFFRIPAMMPPLVTGSIVAWGEAWEALVGAEIIAHAGGVGQVLGRLGDGGNVGILMLGILVYLLLIFFLNQTIWLPLMHLTSRYQND